MVDVAFRIKNGLKVDSFIGSNNQALLTSDTQGNISANPLTINDLALNSSVVQLSGYIQSNVTVDLQQTNSINTLFSTYTNTSTTSAISAGLSTSIQQISGYIQSNILLDTQQANSINTLFGTYTNSTTTSAISAGLNTRLLSVESINTSQTNSINTLFSTYTNSSTTSAISAGLNTRIGTLEEINSKVGEPRGFENLTVSSMSFNESTRVFTISGSFNIWNNGIKYTKSLDTTTLANATNSYFIYYNSSGVFTIANSPWSIDTDVPIALIYYNATDVKGIMLEERHGINMDSATHKYLHTTRGTQAVSIGALNGYTLTETGPSTTVANQTWGIGSSVIADEDLVSNILALTDGSTYSSVHRTGASNWSISTNLPLPFLTASSNLAYNQNNLGTWQLTPVSNNNYVNYYLAAVPAIDSKYQYLLIPGQATYSNLALAQAETISNLNLAGLPFVEFVIIYRFSLKYASNAGRTSTNGAGLEAVASINSNTITSGITPTNNHNALSGLQGGIVGEYYHLSASQYNDYIGASQVAIVSAGLSTSIQQISGYIQSNATVDLQQTNSINTLFSTYTNSSTTSAISAGLNTRLLSVENINTSQTNSINTLFGTYTNSSTTSAISAGLNTRLLNVESSNTSNINSINTLFSTYTNSSTTSAISAGLQTQLNSINIVGGSNVTVVQNPSKTWTISSVGGSSSISGCNSSFGVTIDGGGIAPTSGSLGYWVAPANGIINKWFLIGDQTGSCVVDVLKGNYNTMPSTTSIAGIDKPTITSNIKAKNESLTSWSTSISAGDIFEFYLNSCSTMTRINLIINYFKYIV
jgi:hypothetical protein